MIRRFVVSFVIVTLIIGCAFLVRFEWQTNYRPEQVKSPKTEFATSAGALANNAQHSNNKAQLSNDVSNAGDFQHLYPELASLGSDPRYFRDPFEMLRELHLNTSPEGIRATLSDTSQSGEARYWSAIALGKSQEAGAGIILANLLEQESEVDMQVAAIAGLAYVGDPHSLDVLEGAINFHPNVSIRSSAVSALLRNPSQETLDIVGRTAVDQSQDVRIRQSAIEYLGLVKTPVIANTMRTLLVDISGEIRAKAAIVFSRNNPDEAMSHLVSASQDDELSIATWGFVVQRLQETTNGRVTMESATTYFADPSARARTKNEINEWWKSLNE